MSSHEFSEWIAFSRLEPIGARRFDVLFAMLAATVANSVRDPKDKPEPFGIDDFLLQFESEETMAEIRHEQLRSKINAAMFALGGREE